MTDRELLQLAARAAGYDDDQIYPGHDGGLVLFEYDESTCGDGTNWNPLTTDGDALRLAVQLNLTVYQWADEECCVCTEDGVINEAVSYGEDKFAATRRAIVIAAAELGKAMQ